MGNSLNRSNRQNHCREPPVAYCKILAKRKYDIRQEHIVHYLEKNTTQPNLLVDDVCHSLLLRFVTNTFLAVCY